MDLSGRYPLRLKFANINTVLPEEVAVASRDADHFHRPADREDSVGPSCMGRKRNYSLVATDRAVAAGVAPCKNCYEPVFEYLARQPDSPVEYREGEPGVDDVGDVDAIAPEALADGGRGATDRPASPLTARTETVRIKGGASHVYHAPAANGTLCGERGSGYRSVPYAAVDGHYRPCGRCFDLEE